MQPCKFRIVDILAKKRSGGVLSDEEIKFFVASVTDGSIQDVQIGAMLMAIYLKGMTELETATLTRTMLHSGSVFQWPKNMQKLMVDKHSTGGVGDKISLVLAPALAACGLKVPMISGRGLGFTGGTIDKLESIPGFRVLLSHSEAMDTIEKVGCFIMAQTDDIVPADKILYSCRDVTATVDCNSLITASIMSKKASENLNVLLLDLKCGAAAFMKDYPAARTLAHLMVKVGKELGIKTAVTITRMDCPLGMKIGNALEVEESIDTLRGRGPLDLEDLVVIQGGILLNLSGMVNSTAEGESRLRDSLYDGSALQTLRAMLMAQGVSAEMAASLCSDPHYNGLPKARHVTDLTYFGTDGQLVSIDALELALVSGELGASRTMIGARLNHAVGLTLLMKPGMKIIRGTPWLRVHHDLPELSDSHRTRLQRAVVVHPTGKTSATGVPDSQVMGVIY